MATKKSTDEKPDWSKSYNKFKTYKGKIYTGARVGRGQKWHYKEGEWKEHKVTPDKWEFTYNVPKRRAGNAPEGSGAPIGTEYHWYIIADQIVKKLDANNYSTEMQGVKYKISHKRADKDKWSATDKTQIKNRIKDLQEIIAQLETQLEAEPEEQIKPELAPPKEKKTKSPSRRRLVLATP